MSKLTVLKAVTVIPPSDTLDADLAPEKRRLSEIIAEMIEPYVVYDSTRDALTGDTTLRARLVVAREVDCYGV